MKKVWRFFEYSKGLKKPNLIAITTDKKIAKMYIAGRNKNSMIQRVDKFDNDELVEYLNDNRNAILRIENFKTYIDKNTDRQTPIEVEVVATEFEIMTVEELAESGIYGLLEYSMIRPDIFDKSTFKALKEIDYVDAYKLLNMDTFMPSGGDNWDIPDINWNFDMLALFMFVYDEYLDHDEFLNTIKYKKRNID